MSLVQSLEGGRAGAALPIGTPEELTNPKNPLLTTEEVIKLFDEIGITSGSERQPGLELMAGLAPAALSLPMSLGKAGAKAFGQSGVIGGRKFLSKGLNLSDEQIAKLDKVEATVGPDAFWAMTKGRLGYGLFRDKAGNIVAEVPDTGTTVNPEVWFTGKLPDVIKHPQMDKLLEAYPNLANIDVYPNSAMKTSGSTTINSMPNSVSPVAVKLNKSQSDTDKVITAVHELDHVLAASEGGTRPLGSSVGMPEHLYTTRGIEKVRSSLGAERADQAQELDTRLRDLRNTFVERSKQGDEDSKYIHDSIENMLQEAGLPTMFAADSMDEVLESIKRWEIMAGMPYKTAKGKLDSAMLQQAVKDPQLVQAIARNTKLKNLRRELERTTKESSDLERTIRNQFERIYSTEAGEVSATAAERRFKSGDYETPFYKEERPARDKQWMNLGTNK
jgi:hypothetical protein